MQNIFCYSLPPMGRFLPILGRFWVLLGRSWVLLGRSWAALGRSWGALEALLAALGPLLGALRPLLERYAKIIKKSMQKMTDLDRPKPPKMTCFVAHSHTHAGKPPLAKNNKKRTKKAPT